MEETTPIVQPASAALRVPRPQVRAAASTANPKKDSMPTPNVDCRCKLYAMGQQWCKWFESGDCREA